VAAAAHSTGSLLTIDLDAVVRNYERLRDMAAPAHCAAVVKADGYGLGATKVAPALAAAGCDTFFVAHLGEALTLRPLLPDAAIYVLNGAAPGAERELAAHNLRPVLNSREAVEAWVALGREQGSAPAAIHIDTGMSRLGLTEDDLDRLAADPGPLAAIDLRLVMSHLAVAEEAGHPLNAQQRERFEAARPALPAAPASLANSSGIFLGGAFHFDLVRPGAALYGVNPTPGQANPMEATVRLEAPMLQVRAIDSPRTVGYGATHQVSRPSKIATIPVGYADGYLRSLGNRGRCFVDGRAVPVVGRVSMDLVTLDVTDLPADRAQPGTMVEVMGPHMPVDDVAEGAGTIGYEILTSLGRRYTRRYLGGTA
jgi:alanine racemase